jgi:hypothetical protein
MKTNYELPVEVVEFKDNKPSIWLVEYLLNDEFMALYDYKYPPLGAFTLEGGVSCDSMWLDKSLAEQRASFIQNYGISGERVEWCHVCAYDSREKMRMLPQAFQLKHTGKEVNSYIK